MGLILVMIGTLSGYASQGYSSISPSLSEVLTDLEKVYATKIILGTPLEIDDFKIIPLVTVGIGYGQQIMDQEGGTIQGTGGVLSPVGILVVSRKGTQLLPIPKGTLEQFLGVLTPLLLQIMYWKKEREGIGPIKPEPPTNAEMLAALYSFLPPQGMRFGFFPWPFSLVAGFVIAWLVLAIIVGAFLPKQMVAIADTLEENYLWTGIVGVLSYGVVFLLTLLFLITIIGIPLACAVVVVTWALKFLGTVSIAFLIGQKAVALVVPVRRRSITALQRIRYSEGLFVFIGGMILALIRIIPILGWIVWLFLGMVGLGAVLRTQRRNLRPELSLV